jgi:peptidyl-prolyl cis-trans isomerase C
MENKVLATVGGIAITSADVDEFLLSLGQRGQSYNTPEGRAMVLNQLIDSKLLLLDARKNLLEGEAEFRAQLAKLKENLLVNYAAEKAVKAAKRLPMPTLKSSTTRTPSSSIRAQALTLPTSSLIPRKRLRSSTPLSRQAR